MRLGFNGRSPDHYYRLTAMLAARGAQTLTSRVIAAISFGLGFLAALATFSSAASQLPMGRLIWAVASALALVSGLSWLRRRWPTRRESIIQVFVVTVAIVVGSVIPKDPLQGVLGATALTFVIGYTSLFHALRLTALIMATGLATTVFLAVRIAAHDIALGLIAVVLNTLLYVFAAFSRRVVVELTGTDAWPDGVEPLTGLFNRDSFYEQAATLLGARNRTDDRYFVIAVVNIDSFAAMVSMLGNRGGDRARVSAGQALRETVRRDAILAHVGEAEFLIADTFTGPDPSPLVERARGSIATTPNGMTVSIGVVSTPLRPLTEHPPHGVLDEIVALATTAMHEARRAGGNQVRFVTDPDLSISDDDDDDLPESLI
ncbi:GGDEF domain-containing protein [Candidatus Mycolicibacterium alkanivorans]|uniref:GGDEF domain-containing protein n=1 Tax=Candidatus Mycolicibacterium alkanivorans TaxID=2954114 RepID=A0ABS9YZK6_9MYCO|nr:GGDEF domain-containing protein [Candidatus Mycolicibacterium alkanivorans]MCI4675759.1 GGDEF domain-containing protein [Candidatus Mycolicibacterium alkanivorans]